MLNALKGVVAVHGEKNAETKWSFPFKFVCASRTGMLKPPSWVVALESDLDSLSYTETDS